jgi:hypothetical protein
MNQFNAAKAGVDANIAQSAGQVGAGMAAAQGAQNQALISGISGLAGTIGSSGFFGGGSTPSSGLGLGLGQTANFLGEAKSFNMPSIPGNVMPTAFNYSMSPTG